MWEIIKATANIGQWFGLGGMGLIGFGALWYFVPGLRKWAIMAMAGIAVALTVYGKGVYDNAALEKAKSDRREEKAVERGETARDNASRSVKRGVSTDDGFCRDCNVQ